MTDIVDLEISLGRKDIDSYTVELRFSDPADPAARPPQRGEARWNLNDLRLRQLDTPDYAKLLTDGLLGDPSVRGFFDQVRVAAQSKGRMMRLRLFIDRSAPELHSLRWEILQDPQSGSWMAMNENLRFSRFLASEGWEQVLLRRKEQLTALVAVANPTDLAGGIYEVEDQRLAPVDVAGEIERARQGLGKIPITPLISTPETPGQVTLNRLIETLRKGYDILYLVCHGALLKKEPAGTYLWLEKEDGSADVCAGQVLVDRLRDLPVELRPRLVVLAACQSAGKGDAAQTSDSQGALSALGPRLAGAGILAVLAMQDKISMITVARFMPVFFQALDENGQVDLAMASARGAVHDRPDWWVPALFMRLRDGRIWYTPGFGGAQEDFERWESLKSFIQEKVCTVIIGPAVLEPVLGNQRMVARHWAEKHGYPLSQADQEDLPRIAQFVSVWQNPMYLRKAYRDAIRDELMGRHALQLPDDLTKAESWSPDMVLKAQSLSARLVWQKHGESPYQRLAKLRLPIYITANTGDLLEEALREQNLEPQARLCPWNGLIPKVKCLFEDDPTPEKPLVYHLFGHISEPLSIVLTEDEFFDYLIGVTVNKELIPSSVRAALTSTSLLFLGFRMDDWRFRVFFRMIMAQEGKGQLSFFSHAAAQIEPEADQMQDVARAHRYLDQYFEREKISLYWGTSEDFLKKLSEVLGI